MLIQNALSTALNRNLSSIGFMSFHKAAAARVFNELEYPNIFLSELIQVIDLSPQTEEQRAETVVQLLLLAGLESVSSYATQNGLDDSLLGV